MALRFDKDHAEYGEISAPYSEGEWYSAPVVWDCVLTAEERAAVARGEYKVRPEHIVYIDGEKVP